ncbi:uncharacterized protein LOC119833136 [Zerene cesonia]|uniref:uncharacterized protein LOC119833136 n=1 Tax=Zerene cesonia TaxID=33412 RepID=UPI0018E501F0|nr:uncharacterized protein LOC119833136 [Zerene cesonia]
MDARLFLLYLFVSVASSELVRKKICKGVDTPTCSIHNVHLDPCPDGPAFCLIRRNKLYQVTVDFNPQFSSSNLKLAINGDSAKDATFSTEILPPTSGCDVITCPLQKNTRQSFNTTISLNKRSRGKFPIQIKLWNEDNIADVCCVIFNVRVLK